ncbi:hypothetical protein Slin15195_G100490 [Septoria linicola]|uniref:Uncharacterized protein n=1 Tax=Septoria linicola TaxID=215465 RepID=A0A9Q9EN56_9PEZI|nr:hypothetical protein Slin15195_G100490 [Septoria linicola]
MSFHKATEESHEEMRPDHWLAADLARDLLRPQNNSMTICADDERMWSRRWAPELRHLFPGSVFDDLWDSVLMRCYGHFSGSRPDDERRMLARDPRMRLDSKDIRKQTPATHRSPDMGEYPIHLIYQFSIRLEGAGRCTGSEK